MEIVLKQQIEGFAGAPYVYTYPPLRAFTRQKIFPLETPRFTENLNIYVHVPFCDQQCTFCGYLTAIERSTENKLKYARAVAEEILLYAPLIKRSRITSINLGGGTPSVLQIDGIAHILETLRSINPDISHTAREISIESTPERVSTEWAKDIRRLGFNRLSIGIQSIVDREIGRSGRHNKISVSLEAVNAARLAQIPNLCCDLMYGLEWQTVETWQRSVEILLSLAPETIELYRTVSIPGTIFPVRSASTMTEKEKYKCFIFARDLFLAYGYEQETHLRFVLPGRGFYQQQTNVFAGESLLGIGVGARTYAENMH